MRKRDTHPAVKKVEKACRSGRGGLDDSTLWRDVGTAHLAITVSCTRGTTGISGAETDIRANRCRLHADINHLTLISHCFLCVNSPEGNPPSRWGRGRGAGSEFWARKLYQWGTHSGG